MDPKKQELNPELKQIYERVMSTDVKKNEVPVSSAQPQAVAPQVNPQPAPLQPPSPTPTAGPAPLSAPYLPQTPPAQQAIPSPTPNPQPTPGMSVKKTHSKSMLSGKIIAMLLMVLFVAWGVLWAKIFELF
jgi:hypothetical protein